MRIDANGSPPSVSAPTPPRISAWPRVCSTRFAEDADMIRRHPTVAAYMTPNPEAIAPDALLSEARARMRKKNHRHLAVRRLGEIVGVISNRDLEAAQGDRGDDVKLIVDDAMTPFAFEVPPDAPLGATARRMARAKFGAALVTSHGRLVGIFTTTDALDALADLCGAPGDRVTRAEAS
jgi:acetoin utilization protein AcuB